MVQNNNSSIGENAALLSLMASLSLRPGQARAMAAALLAFANATEATTPSNASAPCVGAPATPAVTLASTEPGPSTPAAGSASTTATQASATASSSQAPAAASSSQPPAPAATTPFMVPVGYNYHVPDPSVPGPYYAISRGHRVGVFAGWHNTSPIVTGVPAAVYNSVSTIAAGRQIVDDAISNGNAAIIP